MNPRPQPAAGLSRRSFLGSLLAAGAAPWVVPAGVLGARGQTPPSGRVSLGVVGVGAQGLYDMRAFLAIPEVRVTALCDVNQRNLEAGRKAVAEVYGSPDVRVYRDFRELHRDPTIDAVLMALPVHWHSLPAIDAVLNGKHLYLEKPMAMSFVEAARVRAAVRKQGVAFQFGTQQRSDMKFRWACELALNGRLGRVREIQVSVPGGRRGPRFPAQPVPSHVDWDRWVGPAPATAFHEEKLQRDTHENLGAFSLGMISCWGIHHIDIAQWGNGADATGPVSVQGEGEFPGEGDLDAILRWKVHLEYRDAAPVTFVSDGTPGYEHGVRFVGEDAWVHVRRGEILASDESILVDPQNKVGTMPVRLPASVDHGRNFVDAIRTGAPTICDIETAVRSDTVCQLALIAVRQGRRIRWNPAAEQIPGDDGAAGWLRPRVFRGDWVLPEV